MPSAKIVERNAATYSAQGGDNARRIFDVTKGRGFRDLDDQAARDLRTVTQKRN